MSNKTCIGCSHFMKGHLRKFTFSCVRRVIYLLLYYCYYSTLFFNIFMNPLTGNRTYIQERTLLRQTISTVQWFSPWTVLMLFTWSRCCVFTFEWILAIASIKSPDFFSCKIQVFVICGALRNCTGCNSPQLTFNMVLKMNVRAKQNKFEWLVMVIDSMGWSNFGSRVPSESWNWKQFDKILTNKT